MRSLIKIIKILLLGAVIYWMIVAPQEPRKTLWRELNQPVTIELPTKPKGTWDMLGWKMKVQYVKDVFSGKAKCPC